MQVKRTGLWARYCSRDGANDAPIESTLAEMPIPATRMDAQAFLHGNCGVFALALNDKFGYPIRVAQDRPDDPTQTWAELLVHVFCVPEAGTYCDVRGISDDEAAFMNAFASDERLISVPAEPGELKAYLLKTMGGKAYDAWYADARELIRRNPDWYVQNRNKAPASDGLEEYVGTLADVCEDAVTGALKSAGRKDVPSVIFEGQLYDRLADRIREITAAKNLIPDENPKQLTSLDIAQAVAAAFDISVAAAGLADELLGIDSDQPKNGDPVSEITRIVTDLASDTLAEWLATGLGQKEKESETV